MALVEQQSREAPARVAERTPGRNAWIFLGIIILAVVAGGIALVLNLDTAEPETATPTRTVAEIESTSVFTEEEQIMMELAAKGYIPMQAVDWEAMYLKEAVAQGYVPEQSLHPYFSEGSESLFTEEELATIELAEKGLIPMQSVDWEEVELKRLANQGLIPRQAAP